MAQPNTAKVVSQTTSRTAVGSWITGSSEPHAAIKVFSDAHLVGEVAAAASGEWSLALLNNFKGNHHELRAYGPHGHPVSCAHIQSHPHNGHASQSNPAAPSIAGISDVTRSSANPFHPASTVGNSLPTLIGFGHAGDVIAVFDGKTQIGSTAVHADGTWVFSTPTLSDGQHDFSVSTANGLSSNHLAVRVRSETSDAPSAVATITSALDEFIDPAGNHHDNVIQNGGKTFDTSPKLLGTLDATLHAGETLVVYRDGVKLGIADVSGLGWSFQDTAVAAGEHVYTARAETAAGARGSVSGDFTINETGPTFSSDIPVLATENFLIFDTRGVSRAASDGSTISFDLLEGVKALEKAGMTVKSYTDSDGFISIEVDWQAYEKAHRSLNFDLYSLTSHRHVDNDKGGLDYYLKIDTALYYSTNTLDKWIQPMPWADAGIEQPATPPAASFITGIYDVYTDAAGNPAQSLIPEGGVTVALLHKITFTFSEPLPQGAWVGDGYEIYRDGVRLQPDSDILEYKYDRVTNIGWVIETNVPPGPHVYTMQVPRKFGEQGAWSEPYSIVEAAPASLAVATITSARDEFIDPNGIHHDQTISAGGKTADPSPQLHGTLSAALHEGEVLAIYRDGQKIGTASITGLAWSYQDDGLTKGQHVYTANVVSGTGEQGAHSVDFILTEMAGTNSRSFEILATEGFLIFDTRLIPRTTSDGKPVSFDLLEGVKMLENAGMTVKSYTDAGGIISIEVDWVAYAKVHPGAYFDLVSHSHIDNDKGGLNSYIPITVPDFSILLTRLGTWTATSYVADGGQQSSTPAAEATINGVFDSYVDADGHAQLSLVPTGGASGESTHRIEGTLSDPMRLGSDWLVIYRDGVKLEGDNHSFNVGAKDSNITWWIIDSDAPPGTHVYTARVERLYGEQGAWSEAYSIVETAPASLAVATITGALDEFIDPSGIHHDQTISAGGKTADPSPQLHGTLSAALHEGEVLAIHRDGKQIGTASVAGLGWSYQDEGLTSGQHIYTANVVSASGEQGVHSGEFAITEKAGTNSSGLKILATEDFLIFDTRFDARATSDGKSISVDMLEGVRMLEKAGMTVKSYTDNGGIISIEVDWVAYTKAQPGPAYLDLDLHRHIDNDQGGIDYYNLIAVPDFPILLNLLGKWIPGNFVIDASGQSPTPAATATITGVFDSYVDAEGHAQLSLIPAGGVSSDSTHRIEGTLSEPMSKWSDSLVIYRDGEKLAGDTHSFDLLSNQSNTTWWIIDNDVPPGPHIYTARVERAVEAQGPWSESYGIQEIARESTQDTLTARMLLNDNLLVVDTGILNHTNADGSIASIQLTAELTLAGGTIAAFQATVDGKGTGSFEADWVRLLAANPDGKLTITAHDNVNLSDQILDIHTVGTLSGQIGHWLTATPDGESAIFFSPADRSVQIHGGTGVNTITVTDDHQTIDLASLTGKTIGSTVTGIERIDLGGQHNTLKIAMIDVLNLGETDLFRADGKQQLMVNGKNVDTVELSNTRVAGIADGDWELQGNAKIGGVAYYVYEHSTAHVELMVQQGVQLSMH